MKKQFLVVLILSIISTRALAANSISYSGGASSGSPYSFTVGSSGTWTPTINSDLLNFITNITISPALPSGLSINSSTGVISGTPTAVSASTQYTVTATWDYYSTVNVTIYISCTQKVTNWKGGDPAHPNDWNTAPNWDNGVPNANTIAQIGVTNSTAITSANQPVVGVTGTSPFAAYQVIMGDNNGSGISLTVNSNITLNITNAITLNHNNNSTSAAVTYSITGSGTITCTGLNLGNQTAPATPTSSASNAYTTKLTCSVSTLTVSGDITLNSTTSNVYTHSSSNYYNTYNPEFDLTTGTLTANNIITTNSSYQNNTTKFLMQVSGTSTNSTLVLNGASPITVATGGSIDFANGGTGTSTINYAASSGTQTVYTGNDAFINISPSVYNNLTLSGAAAKKADGGTLSVSGNLNTSGGAVDLSTNNPALTVSGTMTNAATINQGSGNITVTGALTNSGTLNLGSGNLTLNGNYSNSGTYTQSTGTTTFSGTTQSLTDSGNGTTFNAVTFSGNATKTLSSGAFAISATGVLTLSGTSTILAAGTSLLTLNSNASSSASIAAIPTGCSITGTVTVQRYVTGGAIAYRGYRLISSPVYAATVSPNNVYSINFLTTSSFVTGPSGTTNGFTATGNPSVYLWKESVAPSFTSFISGNWQSVSNMKLATNPTYNYYTNNGSTATNIPVGNGVLFFFRGVTGTANPYTTTTVPTAGVLTMSGTLNQGAIAVKDWYTPSSANLAYSNANATVKGFNCVGNPYASTIDLETYSSTSSSAGIYATGLSKYIYELNPKTHNFEYYEVGQSPLGSVATGNATRYIASGQGFFVQATAASPTLTFNESAKVTTQNTGSSLLMTTKNDLASVKSSNVAQHLNLEMALDSVNTNEIIVRFNNNASAAFNNNEDAPYMIGSGKVSIASVSSDNIALGINTLSLPKTTEIIPLKVTATADGIYTISRKQLAGIPQLYDIWLMDNFKKDSLDLKHNTTYRFNIYKADTNTYGSKRFTLVIRQNPAYAYRLLSFAAEKSTISAQKVQLTWTTENEANYTNFTVERSNDGGKTFDVVGGVAAAGAGKYSLLDNQPLSGNNLYRLKQEDINNAITYSKIIPIAITINSNNTVKSNINIYPNPASNNLNLAIINNALSNGSYKITITNSAGIILKQTTITNNTWQTSVNNFLPGTYLLCIVNAKDNAVIGNAKFVKQ